MEEKIFGGGAKIPLAKQYMCERCADLFFSLQDLGFDCVSPYEDQRELVQEYASTYGPKKEELEGGE